MKHLDEGFETPGSGEHGEDEHRLRRRVEELSILYELMKETTSLAAIDVLLEKVVRLVAEVMDCEIVSVMLLDEETGNLHIQAASGLGQKVVDTAGVGPGEGIAGWVLETGEPLLVENVAEDDRFQPAPHADQYTTGSALCAPLKVKDTIIGVLNVNNKRAGGEFSEEDLRLLTTIAGQAALAIENARLYEALRTKERRLEDMVEKKTRELQVSNNELLRLKEFNERVLQSIRSGIMTVDLEGTVTHLNKAGQEILGRETEEVVGRSLDEVVGQEAFMGIVSAALDETGYRKHEMSVRRPEGREIPIGFSTFPMRGEEDEEGQMEGIILLFRDLTEINELKRMDRLASLGVMSAGIAHEVRNPLTAVKFGLDFLRQEVSEDGEEELDIITKNITRMEEILNSLLRFSRPGKTDFQTHDINSLVHQVLLLIKKQCRDQGVEIELDLQDDLPVIYADESQVQQVMLNICLNAVQMMEEGGALTIKTMPRRHKGRLYAQAVITDTGPGIPPEGKDFLFHPFYSTRNEGTGLGLSITYRIVQDHGGLIDARNRPEGGAAFTVAFPGRQRRGKASG